MRKRIFGTLGIAVIVAGAMLAGSAGFKSATFAAPVPSDQLMFKGTLKLLPNSASPRTYVLIQDKPALSTSTCALTSDGEKTVACQATSNGTISGGVLTGNATIASSDGVIQLSGSVPIGGRATLTGREIDTDGSVTTNVTVTGRSSTWTDGAGVIHVCINISVNEVPAAGDPDSFPTSTSAP
jgi:hypothetical protein